MQKKRLIHYIEEFILILLILLNILDFLELLPADFDYVKKIISWTALGYLLYKASLTRIFFNNHHKYIDILLIASYFMLIFKNTLLFSSAIIEDFVIFYGIQNYLLTNAAKIEIYFLIIGSIIIILLAIYSAFFVDVKKPSLMHIIHEEGKPKNIYKYLVRIIAIYFVYLAFFVVVFNLVMEWLAIAIDAPIIMIGLLFYLFIIIRHYKKYNVESLIYRIGEFGEKFYEKFISLFHYKKTILLGISGMLVLHPITDALSFIIPYIFILKDTLYFSQLGEGHTALLHLLLKQIIHESIIEQISLVIIYLLNIIGILSLLVLPSLFWYIAFTRKKYEISNFTMSLIFTSMLILIISPIFNMSRLTDKTILGVDIKTNAAINLLFKDFFYVIILALIFFILLKYLLRNYRKTFDYLIIAASTLFFTYYIYIFFSSLLFYYIQTIQILFITTRFILAFYFLLFLTINILFYVAGFIMFIDEIIKEKVYKMIS